MAKEHLVIMAHATLEGDDIDRIDLQRSVQDAIDAVVRTFNATLQQNIVSVQDNGVTIPSPEGEHFNTVPSPDTYRYYEDDPAFETLDICIVVDDGTLAKEELEEDEIPLGPSPMFPPD